MIAGVVLAATIPDFRDEESQGLDYVPGMVFYLLSFRLSSAAVFLVLLSILQKSGADLCDILCIWPACALFQRLSRFSFRRPISICFWIRCLNNRVVPTAVFLR